MMIVPVIMSGGVGSRLWPASRQSHPKPFLPVENGRSLLQNTFARAAALDGVKDIVTITALDSSFKTVAEFDAQGQGGIQKHLVLEPFGRDTAAAAAAATHYAAKQFGPDVILLFLAADHTIADEVSFSKAVGRAAGIAQKGRIVTFGIKPNAPETGYGYIEADGERVVRFVEKPDRGTAVEYLKDGRYLWNSGMFCFRADTMLDAMTTHCPDILKASATAVDKGRKDETTAGFLETILDADAFAEAPKTSIDYAIMEKTPNLSVVAADIGWSDVGTWASLSEQFPSNDQNNTVIGDGRILESENCFVSSEGRLIGLVGVRDLAVIDTRDATLVVSKDRSEDVKKLYEELRGEDHPAHAGFPTGYRPWGSYTILDEGAGYKVKRIEVKPGGCLSLQSHKHRSEHWTVVQGVAHVVNGDENIVLNPNESTYIECGAIHRMENRGTEPMTLIEVQTGSYLGEDDIVRYEDIYGRN
ncbi:mannose-1-phosphate guanylyltransferase/mannose-6-phosphate isomerase [Hoeflea prorocentri]|uniref:mannose-1-phosphate guanylyltransferase n=1 Tax=Hoeflea prorocentri TaxID=1922333 RepID=A0A9X3UFG8_9HYPH|nr:mannose-1-phosphate guanylyltransferase/mannose-6-phosphate isomerase [Hoeflea prorocentri]MCY6379853.1 mannose-1-phosphate guanylyltransferase/mannose-6-phosphate isomerase [Hoeflea prorocentri]MDA5397653.1 mannose-1-phosphate guanylyltransferase/mannose-6-phosphate isomerase [Hoeflea prorocentri]